MNTAQQTKPQLSIEVISDVVCPWCYIGKRNLQTALQQFSLEQPQVSVAVRWLPYLLDPETPVAGTPYRAYLENKFGGAAQLEMIWSRVSAAGQKAGIAFAFDRIKLRANTLNAHRLIHRFQLRGDADAVVEALFAAHFQRGAYINDIEVLAAIAAECGDDAAAVRDYLSSTEGQEEVSAQVDYLQQAGITGVPFFFLNQRLAVSGAQPPEVLLDAIHQALNPA